MPKICQFLATADFKPCLRDVQTQLSKLLPNRDKGHESYRPSRKGQSKIRVEMWKRCTMHLISSHTRLKLKYLEKRRNRGSSSLVSEKAQCEANSMSVEPPDPQNIYYNALAHWNYEITLPEGIPTHVSMSEISQKWSSELNASPIQEFLSIDSASNNRELISGGASSNNLEDNSATHDSEPNCRPVQGLSSFDWVDLGGFLPITVNNLLPEKVESLPKHFVPEIDLQLARDSEDTSGTCQSEPGFSIFKQALDSPNPCIQGGFVPFDSQSSRASVKTIGTRISSILSGSARFAHSVFSATNSFRSSRISAINRSSLGSIISGNLSLAESDQEWWHMAVDESNMELDSLSGTNYRTSTRSLLTRPCCGLQLSPTGVPCDVCGFASPHAIARNDLYHSFGWPIEDVAIQDKFGNAALHHAAAVGNVGYIHSVLMAIKPSTVSFISYQNTSGETFLHVLARPINVFSKSYPAHEEILLTLKHKTSDFRGRTCIHKILENSKLEDEIDSERHNDARRQWFHNLEACNSIEKEYEIAIATTKDHIYLRDSYGYTGLAVAARQGLRQIVVALLRFGANPNTRSDSGRSVYLDVIIHLDQAKTHSNDTLHAQILSCAMALADAGAKLHPTETDEYYTSQWPKKDVFTSSISPSSISEQNKITSGKGKTKRLKSLVTHAAAKVIPRWSSSHMLQNDHAVETHVWGDSQLTNCKGTQSHCCHSAIDSSSEIEGPKVRALGAGADFCGPAYGTEIAAQHDMFGNIEKTSNSFISDPHPLASMSKDSSISLQAPTPVIFSSEYSAGVWSFDPAESLAPQNHLASQALPTLMEEDEPEPMFGDENVLVESITPKEIKCPYCNYRPMCALQWRASELDLHIASVHELKLVSEIRI
ncbi:Transcription factor mbp1 [Ciborinia camelliae]|nr:Transcription factor mbp1 [Ciborinia camelliae]